MATTTPRGSPSSKRLTLCKFITRGVDYYFLFSLFKQLMLMRAMSFLVVVSCRPDASLHNHDFNSVSIQISEMFVFYKIL